MSSKRKWTPLLATAAAVGIIALSSVAVYPDVAQAADTAASDIRTVRGDGDTSAALAEALGITEEELEAAVENARQAAIDQAVAGGQLTEEQAEALGERGTGWLGGRIFGRGFGLGYTDSLLADALGITVDELAAAREQVAADQLAQAVEDGDLTQEQADRMLAQQAFRQYQHEQAQAEMQAEIQAAVETGAITQEQADLLLNGLEQGFWGRGFFGRGMLDGGFFRHGLGGMRGRGDFGPGHMFQAPELRGGGRWERGFPGDLPDNQDDGEDAEESESQSDSSLTMPGARFLF